MPAERVTSVYVCCWSLHDPLCQSQTLAYLKELAAGGANRFALITFESSRYARSLAEREVEKRELAEIGIYWYPIPYRRGPAALVRGLDCANGIAVATYAVLRHRAPIVHSRSIVPAAIAMVVAKVCGIKFLYDADGELSREYVDAGHWRPEGLLCKLTARCENLALAQSDSTVVLTEYTRARAAGGGGAPVTVIPCCVDLNQFRFHPEHRDKRRAELGLSSERLFIYVGKVGSWYLVDETFAFFRVATARLKAARLLVLSPDSPDSFHAVAERQGVPKDAYEVRGATREEVAEWLCAADVGMALIAPFESKLACSPVKVGEYLSVGLPVVVTEHIGDFRAWVQDERLGVILEDHSAVTYERAAEQLETLWGEGEALRDRCHAGAMTHVSLRAVGVPRYRDVYRRLLRDQHGSVREKI